VLFVDLQALCSTHAFAVVLVQAGGALVLPLPFLAHVAEFAELIDVICTGCVCTRDDCRHGLLLHESFKVSFFMYGGEFQQFINQFKNLFHGWFW
jgi:hypothetical protein